MVLTHSSLSFPFSFLGPSQFNSVIGPEKVREGKGNKFLPQSGLFFLFLGIPDWTSFTMKWSSFGRVRDLKEKKRRNLRTPCRISLSWTTQSLICLLFICGPRKKKYARRAKELPLDRSQSLSWSFLCRSGPVVVLCDQRSDAQQWSRWYVSHWCCFHLWVISSFRVPRACELM